MKKALVFNRALAFLLSAWLTHAVLRVFVIFRKDAFGFPFVGKPDWYILHALCIDALWITQWSLAFLLLLGLCEFKGFKKGASTIFYILMGFHFIVLLFTVVDHESMRFMGMHLDLSMLATYGNPAAVREVFTFVASDLSIPYLSFALFILCIPVNLSLYLLYFQKRSWVLKTTWTPWPSVVILGTALFAFVFLNFIWSGAFRMRKLRAFPTTMVESLYQLNHKNKTPIELGNLASAFQKQWLLEQGDSSFIFPDTTYPFYKIPNPKFSSSQLAVEKNVRAPNFVLILMESHRGVNAGYLKPFGAKAAATPVLDSLASGAAHAWTRFSCSGIPTINALMSVHLSMLQHPDRYISSDFTDLKHRAFTAELGAHGYRTHFFSAADPSWDGQVPWLRQWYQGLTYDRTRENDASMFQHMSQWMRDSLSQKQPFMVTAMTKTNHYPFNPEPGVRRVADQNNLPDKMLATMEYTEAALGRFLHSLEKETWFANTVFILLADHGFPLSEHGSSTIGYGLYTEAVWIPFLILGDSARMGPPALHHYPASQLDIGPTILALAGIQSPNHYLGHNLFRPASGENSLSYLVRGEQGSVEWGSPSTGYFRIHGPLENRPREQGNEVFNTDQDRGEYQNLWDRNGKAVFDSLMPFIQGVSRLNRYTVEENALWPGLKPLE